MDGTAALDWNREALKRILATLLAMAGFNRAGVQSETGEGGSEPPPSTLPRYFYRIILRLLLPAESAVRRLIIASSLGIAVPAAGRPPRPKPLTVEPQLRRLGIAVVLPPADIARLAARNAAAARPASRPLGLTLPLFDAPRRFFRVRSRTVPAHLGPRISVPGITTPFRLPAPPSPHDPIETARLARRLAALARALDDLDGHALRFARWRARQKYLRSLRAAPSGAAGSPSGGGALSRRASILSPPRTAWPGGRVHLKPRRISPLRPGRPPGGRLSRYDPDARRRAGIREIDEILAHCHALACYALQQPEA